MFRVLLRTAAPVFLATLAFAANADAHCFVGQRFLPATIATDDPCVADDVIQRYPGPKPPMLPANETDVSVDFANASPRISASS